MTEHTPGPWKWRMGDLRKWDAPNPYFSQLCSPHGSVLDVEADGGCSIEISKSDARLIAEAPALLAACEYAVGQLNYYYCKGNRADYARTKLEAAIAKAKGTEQ